MAGNVSYRGKSFGTSALKNILSYRHNPNPINSLLIKSEKLIRLIKNR